MHPDTYNEDIRDALQEVANVAVGQAADKIARGFGTFVQMPIPRVQIIDSSDIQMALSAAGASAKVTAVTQAFIGSGISGEALLMFTDANIKELASLMGHTGSITENVELELVLEMASMLNGVCLQGILTQLDLIVLFRHPSLLARHTLIQDLLDEKRFAWSQTMAIEIDYTFEGYNLTCDLIILFHERSLEKLFAKVALLID
jgi:chemotaxis protein CheC